MRGWVVAVLIVNASVAQAQADVAVSEAALFARADSLARLDPERELRVALDHVDRRCIGVQSYLASPAGIPLDSLQAVWPVLCAYGMYVIPGGSDVVSPGVARLGAVTWEYGAQYNRLLLAILRHEKATAGALPSTPSKRGRERARPAT
jgi:hypothetical protein